MATRTRVTATQRVANYASGVGQAGARRRESNRIIRQIGTWAKANGVRTSLASS